MVRLYKEWADIGASLWLVRKLCFGVHLPCIRKPKRTQQITEYNQAQVEDSFARGETKRLLRVGFCRKATRPELDAIRREGAISPKFLTTSAGKPRLLVDYSRVNEFL